MIVRSTPLTPWIFHFALIGSDPQFMLNHNYRLGAALTIGLVPPPQKKGPFWGGKLQIEKYFFLRALLPLCWRDWFFTKNPCTGDFKKSPVLEEIVFFGKFPYRENNFPVCGPCAVVCGDFEIFQRSLCGGPVLWCVGTFSFSKIPCVWALCCGVWGL